MGLPNVKIRVDGSEVLTDAHGRFAFPSLSPGDYLLSIDPGSLQVGTVPTIGVPINIIVKAGRKAEIEIPVTKTASAGGRVMMDMPTAPNQPASSTPLCEAILELHSADGSDYLFTDYYGHFLFTDLKPGKYSLIIQVQSLPPGMEVSGPSQVDIDLAPGDSLRGLDFHVKPKIKEMEITTERSGTHS
jgi:hypothetical protein